MSGDDYWFRQRYDALMHDEHSRGHPQSDPALCEWCKALVSLPEGGS